MPDDVSRYAVGRDQECSTSQLDFYGEEIEWFGGRASRNGFEYYGPFPTPEVIHIGRAYYGRDYAKEYIESCCPAQLIFTTKHAGGGGLPSVRFSRGLYPVSAALLSVLGRKEYAHILTGWALQARKEFLALSKRLYPAGMKNFE